MVPLRLLSDVALFLWLVIGNFTSMYSTALQQVFLICAADTCELRLLPPAITVAVPLIPDFWLTNLQ